MLYYVVNGNLIWQGRSDWTRNIKDAMSFSTRGRAVDHFYRELGIDVDDSKSNIRVVTEHEIRLGKNKVKF